MIASGTQRPSIKKRRGRTLAKRELQMSTDRGHDILSTPRLRSRRVGNPRTMTGYSRKVMGGRGRRR